MNARLAGILTALETVVIVGIGVGIFFAPMTLVWALDDRFGTDLLLYWRASADLWLLGHGVPIQFSLDEVLAASLGLTDGQSSFVVTLAPLGPAILTFWWGFRMGRRDLVIDHPVVVWFVAISTHTLLSWGLHSSAFHPMASTDLVDALIRPTLFLAAGLVIAQWTTEWSVGRKVLTEVLPAGAWQVLRAGAVAGTAAVVMVMGISAIALSGMLVWNYAAVISLYEALQPGVVGVVALSIAQLALLPTVLVWTGAWLVGPGFSLGSSAVFSPLGTDVQAVPALPMLAALPVNQDALGMGIISFPILAAVIAGALSAKRLDHQAGVGLWLPMDNTAFFSQPIIRLFFTSVLATGFALAWVIVPLQLASGSLGPGRFAQAGPDLAQVTLWWGLQAGVGILIGLFVGEAVLRIRAAEAKATQRLAR
jgi:hypothetical protein